MIESGVPAIVFDRTLYVAEISGKPVLAVCDKYDRDRSYDLIIEIRKLAKGFRGQLYNAETNDYYVLIPTYLAKQLAD